MKNHHLEVSGLIRGYGHVATKEGNPTHNSGTPIYYAFDGVDDRFYIRDKHYDPGDLIREMSVFALDENLS